MAIHSGSKIKIRFTFVDREGAAAAPGSVRVRKGNGEHFTAELTAIDIATGYAEWEGVVDVPGRWKAQGESNGFLSDVVAWVVEEAEVEWTL